PGLGDDRDPVGHTTRGVPVGDVLAVVPDRALGGAYRADDGLHRGGLARGIAAQQADDLAPPDLHAHVAQSGHGAIAHLDVLQAQDVIRARRRVRRTLPVGRG